MRWYGLILDSGLLVTALSTPYCAYGAAEEYSKQPREMPDFQRPWRPGSPESQWELGAHARVCVAARGVLWVSGLHTLDMNSLYVCSYAGSIVALLSWLHFRWPSPVFLTLLTTLVSEIPGDLVSVVTTYAETTGCGDSPVLERLRTRLVWFDAVQYTVVRGAGIAATFWMLWSDDLPAGVQDRPVTEQLYAYSLLAVYTAYYLFYVLRQRTVIRNHQSTFPTCSPPPCQIPEEKVLDAKV